MFFTSFSLLVKNLFMMQILLQLGFAEGVPLHAQQSTDNQVAKQFTGLWALIWYYLLSDHVKQNKNNC